MATFTKPEDIEAWRKARILTNEVYALTRERAFANDFALKDQIRRAVVSIMSNIAEGFERGGNVEFKHFLSIAKGSCGEVVSQLYIALDQHYIHIDTFNRLLDLAQTVARLIAGLMTYLQRSPIKGEKYRLDNPNKKPETRNKKPSSP